jgi:hypothetical protein
LSDDNRYNAHVIAYWFHRASIHARAIRSQFKPVTNAVMYDKCMVNGYKEMGYKWRTIDLSKVL